MVKFLRLNADSRSAAEMRAPERVPDEDVLGEEAFLRVLSLERKRTERSHRPFVLMLLNCVKLVKGGEGPVVLPRVLGVLSRSTRETDVKGWYENGCVIGVIFTEIGTMDRKSVVNALLTKVTKCPLRVPEHRRNQRSESVVPRVSR